ncbi:gliding motility protein GldI [Flavobacterium sp. 316]|uniref:Peptidyl-prolyl cis-trans isomerase n=1 Tax=Flavobacterium sediminilitoris TaxID=2024526 RepID=A0ABY4HLS3_9FLAO|nr:MULTISPECIES: gliding motility-associated peptidyl-prolyl isomerase GldI [Flavobacterium]KIX19963.1 gliding motility protein GldI [Flavobacterium sp. 316]UOX33825.1 gliding motility-associated peptidyl-prolyl isomerase GldI [Flavobacterium sediminilitoris]
MKMKIFPLLIISIFFISCSQQQARKPISQTNGNFIKESIERNKILIAKEEKLIDAIIKKDTLKQYIASKKGYWYKYIVKIEENTLHPKKGDIAYFDYEINSINNTAIYSKEDLKPQKYIVDKQNIMMGLRDGIKLMKKGETVTFIFPSHMAFGYHGDDNRINPNEPLICTVSLNDLKQDTTQK